MCGMCVHVSGVCMCVYGVCDVCVVCVCVHMCVRACLCSYSNVIQLLFLFYCKNYKKNLCFVAAIFYLLNGGQTISKDLLVRILTRTFTEGMETEVSHNSKV